MDKQHHYSIQVHWTGNKGTGTSNYRAYDRNHTILAKGKPQIEGSSDPVFRGDPSRYNPEECLVAALSSCHMLSYLHLCAVSGVVVTEYLDEAKGIMEETEGGGGHFVEVILHPHLKVADPAMIEEAKRLHHEASKLCFIAASVNFPVHHEPEVSV